MKRTKKSALDSGTSTLAYVIIRSSCERLWIPTGLRKQGRALPVVSTRTICCPRFSLSFLQCSNLRLKALFYLENEETEFREYLSEVLWRHGKNGCFGIRVKLRPALHRSHDFEWVIYFCFINFGFLIC